MNVNLTKGDNAQGKDKTIFRSKLLKTSPLFCLIRSPATGFYLASKLQRLRTLKLRGIVVGWVVGNNPPNERLLDNSSSITSHLTFATQGSIVYTNKCIISEKGKAQLLMLRSVIQSCQEH